MVRPGGVVSGVVVALVVLDAVCLFICPGDSPMSTWVFDYDSHLIADEEEEELGEDFQGIVWEGFDPSTSELLHTASFLSNLVTFGLCD